MFLFSNLLQCCNKNGSSDGLKVITIGGETYDVDCCSRTGEQDLKVIHLSSDVMETFPRLHLPNEGNPFECRDARPHDPHQISANACGPPVDRFQAVTGDRSKALTSFQQELKDRVYLPTMMKYPVPPGCSENDPEEVRVSVLLRIFQEFVMDMHRGVYMTQTSATDEYSDMHCQLLDDLTSIKVDQESGCIVEFPLTAVTRIYRIVRNEGRDPNYHSQVKMSQTEHIVVVEFMRRKLVLVFAEIQDAQSFIMCMELLVRFAQEISPPAAQRPGSVIPSCQAPLPAHTTWPPPVSLGADSSRGGNAIRQGNNLFGEITKESTDDREGVPMPV